MSKWIVCNYIINEAMRLTFYHSLVNKQQYNNCCSLNENYLLLYELIIAN